MIEATIKQTEAITAAYIDVHGPYDQIPDAMGRLYRWIGEHDLRPSGMPHAVYYTSPEQVPLVDAEWELFSAVDDDVAPRGPDQGGLGVRHMKGITVASAMHRGPYETVGDTYHELADWVEQHGYTISGPSEEVYFSDPEDVAPEDYLTEIRLPVTKA